MSHQPSHATELMDPPAAQAEEGIPWGKVLAVGIGWAILLVVSIWIVVRVLHAREKELQPNGPDPLPVQIGQGEIGIVDQVPFQGDVRLQKWKAERAEWLNGYGWVDRARGVAHIPIDRAMDEIVAGAVPPPPAPDTMPPEHTR